MVRYFDGGQGVQCTRKGLIDGATGDDCEIQRSCNRR